MATNLETVRVFAPAKINLFLHVGQRRDDGFHALESLVVFADVGDELAIEAADGFLLTLKGPFGAALQAESDNLVARAARALAARAGCAPHANITLTKNLPVASGIGGGSADAAAALRGLVRLWKVDLPKAELLAIAAMLGSDVPACLASETLWMTGRGEGIEPIAGVPHAPLVLVNPGIAVSTRDIFAALNERMGIGRAVKPEGELSVLALSDYLNANRNDLEKPARRLAPVIGDVLTALTNSGALHARMSGSGATCFGLFTDDKAAEASAAKIARDHPAWWVKMARIQ